MDVLTPENILTVGGMVFALLIGFVSLAKYVKTLVDERFSEYKSALQHRDEALQRERDYNAKATERLHQLHVRTVEVLPEITAAVERNSRIVEGCREIVVRCKRNGD